MGGQIADRGYVKNTAGEVVANVVDVKKHQTVNFTQSRSFGAISRRSNLSIASGRTDADTYFEKSYGNPFIASCFKRCVRDHANQAGSLVAPGHLRFDFTHFGQVTSEELARMEAIVNEKSGKLFLLSQLKQILIQRKHGRNGVIWRKIWQRSPCS